MGDHFPAREYGWTESSGSNISVGPFTEASDASFQTSDENETPFARHGPVLEADMDNLNMQRDLWSHCAIGFLLDYRKFSVQHLQQVINSAWRIRGVVSVVGRDSFFYLIHFELLEDLNHFCSEGPWAVDGALLILEKWRPNLVLNRLQLNYVSLWVQLHGLPLDYQYPELAEHMGQLMGIFEKVDWEDCIPRNIRFMRVRVRIDPWMPLPTGFMLQLDDGTRTWVQCRYERVHKLCTRCGLIGHMRGQCNESMDKIERMLIRQRNRIQRTHQVQFGFDSLEPHFHNDLRAYYHRRRRWTTQVRYGNLHSSHHSHAQAPHLSNHPSPNPYSPDQTQDGNLQVFPDPESPTIPNPHLTTTTAPTQPENGHANLYSAILSLSLSNPSTTLTPLNPLASSPGHTLNIDTPPNPTLDQSSLGDLPQALHPGSGDTFILRPPCALPVDSSLRWTWVEGNGPFMTTGTLREDTRSDSTTDSDETMLLFNLDRLNEDRPEWVCRDAWNRGQIPDIPEPSIENLV